MNHANPNRSDELARNVAVALRFKQTQGKPEMPQVEKEVLAPNYDRVRGGNLHLANNARDQGWPHPALYLRAAFPDRVDVMEQVIADGDRVGLLFRVTGTHTGNFFGIPATGRRIDVYEVALLRIINGQMVEGWYMMDEAELLRQLGAKLPPRPDGRIIAPPLPQTDDAATFVKKIEAQSAATVLDRNKLTAARMRLSTQTKAGLAADHQNLRYGFQHLREYSAAHGHGMLDLDAAFPDRGYGLDVQLAEGDQVWTRFNVSGTHRGAFCGITPTGTRMGVNAVAITRFNDDGECVSSWTFADELGVLLQLGQPNLLLE
ncbi:MAG: ester cyclase [Betaproteobacteria bacterium]|jgi:predicted ester cyclase|nr:ester cyclase [Betaproteobacteria bacterium]MDH4293113.1 ester cyclase [Betaproteobacteria bacterium]